MASTKVILRLLKIKDCKLVDISFHHDQFVRLCVKPYISGCLCPECGRRGTIMRSRADAREWSDLKVGVGTSGSSMLRLRSTV